MLPIKGDVVPITVSLLTRTPIAAVVSHTAMMRMTTLRHTSLIPIRQTAKSRPGRALSSTLLISQVG